MDFLIVGQGLAGSLLAWQLLKKGMRVLVVDRDEEITSSKIAAGLVTPIFGSRFKTAVDLETTLPFAQKLYWDLEEETGQTLFHHTRLARIFTDREEAERWERRKKESADALAPYHQPLSIDESIVRCPFGGFEMTGGGWLDLPAFLETIRQALLERASLAVASVKPSDFQIGEDDVTWKNVTARVAIFCEGWKGNQNPFFDWIPMNPSKGEILEFMCPELEHETRILNSGGWIVPLGGGKFRAGSTYDHDFSSTEPTQAAKETIEARIRKLLVHPVEIISHRAAIRPNVRQSRIVMGRHPAHAPIAFFNGLGSKGVLNGPFYSAQLIEHLLEDRPLDYGVDINENFFLA